MVFVGNTESDSYRDAGIDFDSEKDAIAAVADKGIVAADFYKT
jgi:hypothetical protein